jgi:hypothetical protein
MPDALIRIVETRRGCARDLPGRALALPLL